MQEHYAGAAARAISEPRRCSSAWSAVISEKSETRKVLRLEATDATQWVYSSSAGVTVGCGLRPWQREPTAEGAVTPHEKLERK